MDLVLLLNKLNNEVGFNIEFFRNFSGIGNRSISDIGSIISQVDCSTESFERVGKRPFSKSSVELTRTFDHNSYKSSQNSKTLVAGNTVTNITDAPLTFAYGSDDVEKQLGTRIVDKIKRKSTIILDKIPEPREIIPKTILFNINSVNIGNVDTVTKSQENINTAKLTDIRRFDIDPFDVL